MCISCVTPWLPILQDIVLTSQPVFPRAVPGDGPRVWRSQHNTIAVFASSMSSHSPSPRREYQRVLLRIHGAHEPHTSAHCSQLKWWWLWICECGRCKSQCIVTMSYSNIFTKLMMDGYVFSLWRDSSEGDILLTPSFSSFEILKFYFFRHLNLPRNI